MPAVSLDGTQIGAYSEDTKLTPINTNWGPQPQEPWKVQAVAHGISILGGEGHSWSGQVIIMCPVRVDGWRKEDWGIWLNSTGNEQVRSWGAGMLEIPKVYSQVEAGSCA